MAETLLNQRKSKLDPSPGTQRSHSHLKNIVGIILSLVMIALTIYVLALQNQNLNILSKSTDMALITNNHSTANYRTYVGRYQETKIELDETTQKLEEVNHQLDKVTVELEKTKSILSQTQGMLFDAQEEDAKLRQELKGLDDLRNAENVQNIGELEAKIKFLKDKDSQVSFQLAQFKSQMRVFAAEFSNLKEGRSLIVLFQNKIKSVKNRIRYLKQEAYFARVAAQKEKDRLAVLNGNSGFMVRNGQIQNPNGTKKSFAIDVKIVP